MGLIVVDNYGFYKLKFEVASSPCFGRLLVGKMNEWLHSSCQPGSSNDHMTFRKSKSTSDGAWKSIDIGYMGNVVWQSKKRKQPRRIQRTSDKATAAKI